jgi:mannose-6-phosphate isomerase-like protein (cupin superfamily)
MTKAHAGKLDLTSGWRDGESNGRIDFAVATDKIAPGSTTGRRANGAEQVVMVVEGSGRAYIGGEETDLSHGTSLLIPARVPHEVENVGASILRLVTAVGDQQAA